MLALRYFSFSLYILSLFFFSFLFLFFFFYFFYWVLNLFKELRNPFNPILGEVFKCSYEHPDSTTKYIAEQISHHPPSSAFCVINEDKGMYLTAYIRPSFKFKGNSLESTRKF